MFNNVIEVYLYPKEAFPGPAHEEEKEAEGQGRDEAGEAKGKSPI